MNTSNRPVGKGRPTSKSMFEVLSEKDDSIISEAALRETTYVAMTMMKFPLLSFANVPLSHLASATVRSSVQLLADALQESFHVPESIATAYRSLTPYALSTSKISPASTLQSIPLMKLIPNDGDGLVEILEPLQQLDPSQNLIYHRLFAVDAPELYSTSFINVNGKVHKRRNGHLSHLAVHYYFNSFVSPQGTGSICKESPRRGEIPTDKYQRQISSFWFVWFATPNSSELSMLDEIMASLEGQQDWVQSRIMSNFNPRAATTENPFLVNLNALLVLSGFCHVYTKYSPDAALLKLQEIAQKNKIGSIWSIKKNFVLGANQEDYSNVDETMKTMAGFDHASAVRMGFPLKFQDPSSGLVVRFQPWHERLCKRELEKGTRYQFREHQKCITKLPYGFVIDMHAIDHSSSPQCCNYTTIKTGESFLQARPSLVVGIGGSSTGLGLFTLKEIPQSTWITSYAPTAPVRLGQNHDQSDFIIKTTRNGSEVEIDGKLCPLGLGRLIQDGTFPFILASERFARLVKARVNCQWAIRDGEIWFKSTRTILAGEELLTRYSHDNSYWRMQFSVNELQSLRQALLTSNDGSLSEGERLLRSFSFVH